MVIKFRLIFKVAVPQFAGIASSSESAVETTEGRDYSILAFRDYRLEIQATTAGRAGGLRHGGIGELSNDVSYQDPIMNIISTKITLLFMNKELNKFPSQTKYT
ncbi:hypothetical protein LOT_1147 [Lentilactobacillus otakiensis DSM 19908 = JCM 15040]|uniref:Uncharacterized protein n=1 Tax=Lentilactobacillus otakiensis DSM 19908 = JCM 15040 TaxID=1423780 RepID=S4NCR6_9LACO|nr:hypothetical protein LOT_1147 [Lentilactobacillus otakiensis DSM 19908 = JCM 15040]